MRLKQIGLLRYGKFTNLELDFTRGRGKRDFHLVVGANEAGKSTLRSAITDLLYGIETRSSFAFLHPYAQMCLAGELTQGSESLCFKRYKKTKNALTDFHDEPLPNMSLAAFLGNSDREFFERMFGLDHDKLVRGGVDILSAKDDVARTLFQASSGLASLGTLRDELETEARSLWTKQRSGERAFYKSLDEFSSAEQRLKEATVLAKHWQALTRGLQQAQERLDAASDAYDALERERGRLERIRRVAPHLHARRARLDEIESLESAGVVLLPETAPSALAAAQLALADAERVRLQQQALIDDAVSEREKAVFDETVLTRKDEIEALYAQMNAVAKHPLELANVEVKRDVLLRKVQDYVRELGLPFTQPDEIRSRLPSKVLRTKLHTLMQEHGAIVQSHNNRLDRLQDARRELEKLQQDLAALPEPLPPDALDDALRRAQRLADTQEQRAACSERVNQCRHAEQTCYAQLTPWRGDVKNLRTTKSITEVWLREYHAKLQDLSGRLAALREQEQKFAGELDALELKRNQSTRATPVVSVEELDGARSERDRQWQAIRSGKATLEEGGGRLERAIASADSHADRRYANAALIKEVEQLTATIEQRILEKNAVALRIEKLQEEVSQHESVWRSRLLPFGLEALTPLEMLDWLDRRNLALAASEQLAVASLALRTLHEAEAAAIEELQEALGFSGPADAVSLSQLMAKAQNRLAQFEREQLSRSQYQTGLYRLREELARQEQSLKEATDAKTQWQNTWRETLERAAIPVESEVAGVSARLEQFAELAATLEEIRSLEDTRLATLRAELREFDRNAQHLANVLAINAEQNTAQDIAVLAVQRLTQAQILKQKHDDACASLDAARTAVADANLQKNAAETAISPLMAQCGAATVGQLELAVTRSKQLREVQAVLRGLTAEVLSQGDGAALDVLEKEMRGEDLDTLTSRLEDIAARRLTARAARDDALTSLLDIERRHAEVAGQADAAEAESARQLALAELGEITDRFLSSFVGARLLRWAIDRYREEKQGPLLGRASTIFATLTDGSFERLMVDFDDDTPKLIGRRAGGQLIVDVEGMSDGTRDQLYLALRLAAIELHLDTDGGHPLPFVADDLFINYDDVRSSSGFASLGSLAERTQVIFLTHHEHLVDIARDVLGKGINVVHL